MSQIKRLITTISLGVVTGVCSGAVYSSDIMSSYELAKVNDRTFSAAKHTFEAVKQTQRQAKGQYYPSLNISLEHTETEQEINRSDNEVFGQGLSDFPTDDLTLSLSQPIFRWDFVSDRKVAKAEVRAAEFQFISAEQELILRTAEAYLLTLAAKDNEFVTRAELDAVQQQLALAEKRLDVGLASPTEVHESQARFQLNQAEVIEAENAIVDRTEGLRTITGEDPGQLMPLLADFQMVPPEPADSDQWVSQAMGNNLAIKSREAALEVATEAHKRQKADRYPTLDLVARFNNRDTGGSLFGGGSDVDTNDIVLRADWTVFQGGVLRARIKEALYNKMRAEDDLELERSNVRKETRNAYLGVVSGIARATALKASLDAQEMTVEAKQKGFETGTASNIEVLDAKRDFFFVQRDFLKARYDYLLSLLNLKRQVGSLSPADLETINGMLNTADVRTANELEVARNVAIPEAVTESPALPIAQPTPKETPPLGSEQYAEIVYLDQPMEVNTEFGSVKTDDQDPLDRFENNQILGHEWLFAQEQDSYSNQLASFESEEHASDYIRSQELTDSYYFRSSGNGHALYFVLSGIYESRGEALNSGSDGSWTRKVSELQAGRCKVLQEQEEQVATALNTLCQQQGYLAAN